MKFLLRWFQPNEWRTDQTRLFYYITLHESLVSFLGKSCASEMSTAVAVRKNINRLFSRLNALLYDLASLLPPPPSSCVTLTIAAYDRCVTFMTIPAFQSTIRSLQWNDSLSLNCARALYANVRLTYDWWNGNLRVRTVGRAKISWKKKERRFTSRLEQQYLELNEEKAETWSPYTHTHACMLRGWCEIFFHCVLYIQFKWIYNMILRSVVL